VIPTKKKKHRDYDTLQIGRASGWEVIDSGRIIFSFRVPKDSVKVQDSTKTVTLKPIPNEPSWFEKKANEIFYFVIALVLLGFVVKYNWSK